MGAHSSPLEAVEFDRDPNDDDLQILGVMKYGEEEFTVTTGRSPEVADEIIEAAKEPFMQRMVPKDSREGGRFSTLEKFKEWYAKGRFLTCYWDENRKLAAVVWHGPSSLQEDLDKLSAKGEELEIKTGIDFAAPKGTGDTMAIRIYKAHRDKPRGKGEDTSFARRVLSTGQALFVESRAAQGNPVGNIWLETNLYEDNPETSEKKPNGAVFLYERAGYRKIGEFYNPDPTNLEERVVMVTDPYRAERTMGTAALLGFRPVSAES